MLSIVCVCVCVVHRTSCLGPFLFWCVWLWNRLTNEAKGKVKKSDTEQREGHIPYPFQSAVRSGSGSVDSVLYIERVI